MMNHHFLNSFFLYIKKEDVKESLMKLVRNRHKIEEIDYIQAGRQARSTRVTGHRSLQNVQIIPTADI